jgi:signal transduction histidine kinase
VLLTEVTLVGANQYDLQDEDGRYYVREFIQKANDGGGWIDFKIKNAIQTAFVEKIDLGIEEFVIGSGVYPVSKRETMLLLAKSAAGYLRMESNEVAFAEFSKSNSKFIRGDLDVMLFDMSGICYAYGDDHDLIWRNLMGQKDDTGKQFIKMFINTAKRGPGTVTYTLNGATKLAYIEPVEKGGKTYIAGSSFYL